MHSLAEFTPEDRPDPADPMALRTAPARVIEIGEITAGIAVPEGRGVRFFSSARDFDGLDGVVFRTAEQAARAARARMTAQTRPAARAGRPALRRA
ncbi:hypothetical protein ACRBEV_04860 [Methylobacterium phyllosphaerae]|jgi:hypothetical protein